MKPYQEEYIALLSTAAGIRSTCADTGDPDAFLASSHEANRSARDASAHGTRILREHLFPMLDDIMNISDEDADSLYEFAGKLMSGVEQKDVGLHYRIHSALLFRARRRGDRDALIRELYLVGMSLYNLETMLSPNPLRLYTTRMRMCFAEAASHFETDYDEITDPDTRGYIHRSMGNIALSYDTADVESAKERLAVTTRSIRILSDPDIRAKTPSLPWDTYLYKSHQERTTLLSFLRSGTATPEAFAQVLESAQIVEERQQKAFAERGGDPQPRWQYAYMAARYHCGAMLLPEFLEGLYSISFACGEDDYGPQSMFTHISAPALYMEYMKHLKNDRDIEKFSERIEPMTRRMCSWLAGAPSNESNEQLMFYIRQFVYTYRETEGGMTFFDLLCYIFASRHPAVYARMWITGRICMQLAEWILDDTPYELSELLGCTDADETVRRRCEITDFVLRAGMLHDAGMIHFINLDSTACRELFEEEAALIRLHTVCGHQLLRVHTSTKKYADIAFAHHMRYDGKNTLKDGTPLSSSPIRAAVWIVSAADVLAAAADETFSRYSPIIPFDEACDRIIAGSGRRYAPFVADVLRPKERRETLRRMLESWERDAFLDIYDRRESMPRLQ